MMIDGKPQTAERAAIGTDFVPWSIGPYHSALPGPIRFHFLLDGEIISSCWTETGYLHRGVEKGFELRTAFSALPLASRIDPDAASFGELAFCLAAEEILGCKVPRRAEQIRLIVCELNRISSHLGYLARVARASGADTMFHFAMRDRERALDLFELLTGARFALSYFRFGGVRLDVTEGFIERVVEYCTVLQSRLREYNDLFSFNYAFLRRSRGVGVIPLEWVHRFGVSGPAARASGSKQDLRKDAPYSLYEDLDFRVISGQAGDVHERYLMRLREIEESVLMVRQLCEGLDRKSRHLTGPKLEDLIRGGIPAGESFIQVESPRGRLGCYFVSSGEKYPVRVQFKTPSMGILSAIPEYFEGGRLEDFPLMVTSLDLNVGEVDR